MPKSVTIQVAPASTHGFTSWPGATLTTTSNGSPAGRAWRTSLTNSASASGPGRPVGNRPSHRAARRTGRRCGHSAATQTGILGCCTGTRLELPGPVPGEVVEALVEQPGPAHWVGACAERLNSPVAGTTDPDSKSEAARAQQVQGDRLPRATFCTRRRDNGVIIGPIRSLLVAPPPPPGHPRIGYGPSRRTVHDVVPDEESVPAMFLRGDREASARTRGSASSPKGAASIACFTRVV